MVFGRIGRWLEPVLSGVKSSGFTAPATAFVVLLVIHVVSWLSAKLVAEEHKLELMQRPTQKGQADIARPAVKSASVDSVVSLAEQLIVNLPYRGEKGKADWMNQGLGLCAELDELERQGRLGPREVEVSRRFVNTYLHLRPSPPLH